MARKGYEPEWRKKIRRAAQRATAWLRVERKRLEGLPFEERKRLEELRVEWETAKSKGFPFEERKRLEELRVEWETAKRVARKLRAERFPTADYVGSVRGKVITIECKAPGKKVTVGQLVRKADGLTFVFDRDILAHDYAHMVIDALAKALAKRIPTMQPGRRKAMSIIEEVTELSPLLCPIPKAAMMVGRGTSFIYDAIADGRIKAKKSDKRTLVVVSSLIQYVNELDDAVIKPRPKRAHHRRKKNPQPSIPPQKRAVSPSL
jgi:hypothetical protein